MARRTVRKLRNAGTWALTGLVALLGGNNSGCGITGLPGLKSAEAWEDSVKEPTKLFEFFVSPAFLPTVEVAVAFNDPFSLAPAPYNAWTEKVGVPDELGRQRVAFYVEDNNHPFTPGSRWINGIAATGVLFPYTVERIDGVDFDHVTITYHDGRSTSDIDANPIPGAQGLLGADGNDGLPGADGNDGVDGSDGNDGLPGQDGNDGNDGQNGINCWDLNGNGFNDPEEDRNGDGLWNALDCQVTNEDLFRTAYVAVNGTTRGTAGNLDIHRGWNEGNYFHPIGLISLIGEPNPTPLYTELGPGTQNGCFTVGASEDLTRNETLDRPGFHAYSWGFRMDSNGPSCAQTEPVDLVKVSVDLEGFTQNVSDTAPAYNQLPPLATVGN